MKHLSLAVMALSLQRVAALLSATASKSSSKDARKEAFRDTVLRSLPDIKTVIALHHNLLKAGSERAPTVSGASETPPELQLRCEGTYVQRPHNSGLWSKNKLEQIKHKPL